MPDIALRSTFIVGYRDAPEVDGYVIIPGELPLGEMVQAKIVDAMEYDLVGEVESLLQK